MRRPAHSHLLRRCGIVIYGIAALGSCAPREGAPVRRRCRPGSGRALLCEAGRRRAVQHRRRGLGSLGAVEFVRRERLRAVGRGALRPGASFAHCPPGARPVAASLSLGGRLLGVHRNFRWTARRGDGRPGDLLAGAYGAAGPHQRRPGGQRDRFPLGYTGATVVLLGRVGGTPSGRSHSSTITTPRICGCGTQW